MLVQCRYNWILLCEIVTIKLVIAVFFDDETSEKICKLTFHVVISVQNVIFFCHLSRIKVCINFLFEHSEL